jgi:hypothetical protein
LQARARIEEVPSHPPFSLQHDNDGLARIQTVELGNRDYLDVLAEFRKNARTASIPR